MFSILFSLKKERTIEQTVHEIQQGNKVLHNQLIQQYKPFIAKTVSNVCKRFIHEGDDELSIGLIAFNEAIEKYAPHKGVTTGKLLQIEQKMKTVSLESTKAKKLEKPLEQNDGENEYPMDNHSLNKKDEKNQKKNKDNGNQKGEHRRNNHSLNEKDEKNRGNNHSLQKKDKQKREENNSNEKKYPFEEKDEQKK